MNEKFMNVDLDDLDEDELDEIEDYLVNHKNKLLEQSFKTLTDLNIEIKDIKVTDSDDFNKIFISCSDKKIENMMYNSMVTANKRECYLTEEDLDKEKIAGTQSLLMH